MFARGALLRRWQALGPDVGVLIETGIDEGANHQPPLETHPALTLEMGSVFRVFLLAAFARLVDRGEATWEQPFELTSATRVPHSAVLESRPDGDVIPAHELLVAMICQSDNTATQIMLGCLPVEEVDHVLQAAGLEATRFTRDLVELYVRATADPLTELEGCRTTVVELVWFYRFSLSGRMLERGDADRTFRDILGSEGLDQEFVWGAGMTCLRKSGYVAPPPLPGIGFAGAMLGGAHPLVFAFDHNRRIDEGAKELADAFGRCIRDTLLSALTSGNLSRMPTT